MLKIRDKIGWGKGLLVHQVTIPHCHKCSPLSDVVLSCAILFASIYLTATNFNDREVSLSRELLEADSLLGDR